MLHSISDLESKLEDLPLLPAVLTRLLALDPNDEEYFEGVFELAEEDPTFALRIIRMSNSPLSAPISPITTLREAVTRIGITSVTGLITSMSAIRVFVPIKQGEKNLWRHSIQVAVGARKIAKHSISHVINPEQAYLCGLLHDIGRFVIFDKESDEMNMVDESHWQSPEELVKTEQEIFGYNHSELGERVCKKWALPELIVDVVGKHHDETWTPKANEDQELANLLAIIRLADAFSIFVMLNPEALEWDDDQLREVLVQKCIQPLSHDLPIDIDQLQMLAKSIVEESRVTSLNLGI